MNHLFHNDGRIKGVSFCKRSGKRPTQIFVRTYNKKATGFTLENASFFTQYERAVEFLRANGVDISDSELESSKLAFLKYYHLRVEDVVIKDVVKFTEEKK